MILAAAEVEFAETGVRKANVDTVAARAGVSRSTLYRRFASKGGTARRGGAAAVMNG